MSVEETKFHGVWVAMVTPWDNERRAPRRDVSGALVVVAPMSLSVKERSRL